jgi:hypothetical protein
MEVKIGVVYTPREIVLDTDDDATTVSEAIESAFTSGDSVLWLTDTKGRRIAVPTDKIAYVEVGSDAGGHQVGFGVR